MQRNCRQQNQPVAIVFLCWYKTNMKSPARLLKKERHTLPGGSFVEVVIWQVPEPLEGSAHDFKYRLAYVAGETCVLRYDNEAGKGDHKHVGRVEVPCAFITLEQLVDDFWNDVFKLRGE